MLQREGEVRIPSGCAISGIMYKKGKTFARDPQKAMYNVSKKLTKATAIKVGEERFITIAVEDKDRDKAAEIANCYGTSLDRVYTSLTMNQGRKAREFIEKRLEQEEGLLKKLEYHHLECIRYSKVMI